MSIKPLPPESVAQIKSSTAITSLNGVVLELMKNSLDAGSTKLEIGIDYARGGCVVEDNGLGILPSEFGPTGGLGKIYHSSKLDSQSPVHGSRGTFLASLGAVSLLTVTSHHHQHRSHNTLSMHKSEIVSRQIPSPAHQYPSPSSHGSRVTVQNLFGNIPVRVKQRVLVSEKQGGKEWESLKSCVALLCLAWPGGVVVTVREFASGQKMVIRGAPKHGLKTEVAVVCNILSQLSFIAAEEKAFWVSVGASTSRLNVSGTISLAPSPTKKVQFISYDIQPILAVGGQSVLHDEINRLFLNSAFGNEEEADDLGELERDRRAKDARYKKDGHTNKQLKGGKKGVDRWPMFYLNIQQDNIASASLSSDVEDMLDNRANSLSAVIGLIQAMVVEFLTKHHFITKTFHNPRSRNSTIEDLMPDIQEASRLPDLAVEASVSLPLVSRLSTKPSGVERNRFKSLNPYPDLSGTNMKLPSFRQSPSSKTPFDGWSRVKSGNIKPALAYQSSHSLTSDIKRPLSAPPFESGPSIPRIASIASKPLISSTGKITRPPFDDTIASSPQPNSTLVRKVSVHSPVSKPTITSKSSYPTDLTKYAGDASVTWINPATKVECITNSRTGHTVVAANEKLAASLSGSPSSSILLPRQKLHSDVATKVSQPSPWLSNLLRKWENPIYCTTEPAIPQVILDGETEHVIYGRRHNCTQFDINQALCEASPGIQRRISKSALWDAEVIGQVDRKFILVKLSSSANDIDDEKMLAIIDQHAADERIRVELLLAELCTLRPAGSLGESGVVTTKIERDLVIEVSCKEIELLDRERNRFAEWGICYDIPLRKEKQTTNGKGDKQNLTIRSLPPSIVERCKAEPKLLLELIRTELYSNPRPLHAMNQSSASEIGGQAWLQRIHRCPQGIIDMINSRACRSAIMFNDVLSKEQCEILVTKLADTAFPFQCAHGRPTLLPLVELGVVERENLGDDTCGEDFGSAFKKWKTSAGNKL